MAENQDFLSPHQCFIIYDDFTKKIAISIRNRLSGKGIKCTVWDEKHFRDNEARMSNYNRLLILHEKIADEYLANPVINIKISDFVLYRREGRTASLTLADPKANYDKFLEMAQAEYERIKKIGNKLSEEDKNALNQLTPGEIAEAYQKATIDIAHMLPADIPENDVKAAKANKYAKLLFEAGFGTALIGFPLATASVFASIWAFGKIESIRTSNDCKRVLLFAASMIFEKDYIDDFVNAE